MLPGSILEADFTLPSPAPTKPHSEDRNFQTIRLVGKLTSSKFRDVLERSASDSIESAFGDDLHGEKVYKIPPDHSIITIKVNPHRLQIVRDQFNDEKIKAHVIDATGLNLSFLPITDLGFYDHVGNSATRTATTDKMNSFIAGQDELYLRIGLSRIYKNPKGVEGYWLQVNGIYTFPDFRRVVREYGK